jgi:hypothetical protein
MHNATSKGVHSGTIDGIKIGCATVSGDNDPFSVKRELDDI